MTEKEIFSVNVKSQNECHRNRKLRISPLVISF